MKDHEYYVYALVSILLSYDLKRISRRSIATEPGTNFTIQTLQQSFINYRNHGAQFYTEKSGNIDCRAGQHFEHWGFSGEWFLVVACVIKFWFFWSLNTLAGCGCTTPALQARLAHAIYRAIADNSEVMREDLGQTYAPTQRPSSLCSAQISSHQVLCE